MVCNISFIAKSGWVLKVIGISIHFIIGIISETVLDRDVTISHLQELGKWYMAYLIAAIVMTLGVLEGQS